MAILTLQEAVKRVRKPKRGIVYKSFRSIRRDCAIRTDGIFFIYLFFFRSSCTAASPPPLFHFPPAWLLSYSNASHARNPRGGASWQQIQHGKERKRLKKEERKWRKNKLSRSEYIHSEKNCHCCWAKRSFNTRDWPLLLPFFLFFFFFETIACSSRARQIQLQQYIDDGFFFSGCVVYFTAGIPQTRSSVHSMKNKQTWTEFSPRSWKLWQSSYR